MLHLIYMRKEIFKYSKCRICELSYYGLHFKKGKCHIDTKRLKKLSIDKDFPEEIFLNKRNMHYFSPQFKSRYDYAVNELIDRLEELKKDWKNEYTIAIKSIKTPKQVYDETYIDEIAKTCSKDDYESVNVKAIWEGANRGPKYEEIKKSIHLQFLQKIFADYLRTIIVVLKKEDIKQKMILTLKNYMNTLELI